MDARENLVQLSDSMPHSAVLLNDEEDVDKTSSLSLKSGSTLKVVVLGNTGVGKSAVLNSLIGHPVLPTGENGATRGPICVDLERDEQLSKTTVLMQIDGKTQSVTASKLRHSLQARLDKISRTIRDEINLKLNTSTAPALKLIDLPGVDKWNPLGHSVHRYAKHNDAILLVIITASQAPDVSSAKALRIAKYHDEKCTRTIGVISKIDQASADPKANIPWVALIGQYTKIAYAQSVKTGSDNLLETAWRAESESLKSILTGAPQSKLGRLSLVDTLAFQIRSLLSGTTNKKMSFGDSATAPSYSYAWTPIKSGPGRGAIDGEPEGQTRTYLDAQHGGGDSSYGFNGDRLLIQTENGGPAPNLDVVVRENESHYGYGYNSFDAFDESAPTESKANARDPISNAGVSTTFDSEESPGFSMVRGNFSNDDDLTAPYY